MGNESLMFRMGLDSNAFQINLQKAKGAVDRFQKAVQAAGSAFAIKATLDKLMDLSNYANRIVRVSREMGMSTQFVQGFVREMERIGEQTDRSFEMLARFTTNLGRAQQGNAEYAKKFKDAGVAVFDAAGNARDAQSVFLDFTDSVAKASSNTLAYARANSLLEENGVRALPILRRGRDEIERLSEAITNIPEKRLERLANIGVFWRGTGLQGLRSAMAYITEPAALFYEFVGTVTSTSGWKNLARDAGFFVSKLEEQNEKLHEQARLQRIVDRQNKEKREAEEARIMAQTAEEQRRMGDATKTLADLQRRMFMDQATSLEKVKLLESEIAQLEAEKTDTIKWGAEWAGIEARILEKKLELSKENLEIKNKEAEAAAKILEVEKNIADIRAGIIKQRKEKLLFKDEGSLAAMAGRMDVHPAMRAQGELLKKILDVENRMIPEAMQRGDVGRAQFLESRALFERRKLTLLPESMRDPFAQERERMASERIKIAELQRINRNLEGAQNYDFAGAVPAGIASESGNFAAGSFKRTF